MSYGRLCRPYPTRLSARREKKCLDFELKVWHTQGKPNERTGMARYEVTIILSVMADQAPDEEDFIFEVGPTGEDIALTILGVDYSVDDK